jgi:hypothetical protein
MAMTISSGDMMDMFKAMSKEMKAAKKVAPTQYAKAYGVPQPAATLSEANLFPILDKFGDERVRGMYESLVDYHPGDWSGCAIARAFGSFGDLERAASAAGQGIVEFSQSYFHITPMEVNAIVSWYDARHNRKKFMELIELYLKKRSREGTVAVEVYTKEGKPHPTVKSQEKESVSPTEQSDKASARVGAEVR